MLLCETRELVKFGNLTSKLMRFYFFLNIYDIYK